MTNLIRLIYWLIPTLVDHYKIVEIAYLHNVEID